MSRIDKLPDATGDFLIAADGIRSSVRALLYPDEGQPRWRGGIRVRLPSSPSVL